MATDDGPGVTRAWEKHAKGWARWARAPGHDSYWRFHRDRFLALVPPPGRLTLDVGCGEGRLARDLRALGHRVVAVDASPTLARLAAEADPELEVVVADAASLPFADGAADLAVAFMSLMDMDDMAAAGRELGRVVEPGGRVVVALVHPVNSAGTFADEDDPETPFVLRDSYFEARRYVDVLERDGLTMTFESVHWPLEAYVGCLTDAGFLVEAVREVTDESQPRWRRIPMFLHVRAVRAA